MWLLAQWARAFLSRPLTGDPTCQYGGAFAAPLRFRCFAFYTVRQRQRPGRVNLPVYLQQPPLPLFRLR
jgi:hypothetical protein